MRTISILCSIVFLLSLAAWPVIDYAGGRSCMPSTFPPLWPAELTASAIGLLAAMVLVVAVIKSLWTRAGEPGPCGALGAVTAAGSAFWFCPPELPGFLHGLDRFVAEVGIRRRASSPKRCPRPAREAIIRKPDVGSPPAAAAEALG